MTDTYNDTTGSRKKFLIPLVVLLLCAVSLTGAGYAYNSSVTLNDNTDPVDEKFVLELYDGSDNVITSRITSTDAVNGIVFATDKVVGKDLASSSLEGSFVAETMTIVLYQGKFQVIADELARGTAGDVDTGHGETTQADVSKISASASIKLKAAPNTELATFQNVDIKFYSNAACTNEVSTVNVNTDAYFRIIASGISDHTVTKTLESAADLDADAFADATLAAYEIVFNFGIQAEAKEVAA